MPLRHGPGHWDVDGGEVLVSVLVSDLAAANRGCQHENVVVVGVSGLDEIQVRRFFSRGWKRRFLRNLCSQYHLFFLLKSC